MHGGKLNGGSAPLLCGPDEQFPWHTGKKSTASGKMCFFSCGHECTREDNSTVSQPNILLKEHTDLNPFFFLRLLRIIRETCLMSCPEAHKDDFLWKSTVTTGCWETNATERRLRKWLEKVLEATKQTKGLSVLFLLEVQKGIQG